MWVAWQKVPKKHMQRSRISKPPWLDQHFARHVSNLMIFEELELKSHMLGHSLYWILNWKSPSRNFKINNHDICHMRNQCFIRKDVGSQSTPWKVISIHQICNQKYITRSIHYSISWLLFQSTFSMARGESGRFWEMITQQLNHSTACELRRKKNRCGKPFQGKLRR